MRIDERQHFQRVRFGQQELGSGGVPISVDATNGIVELYSEGTIMPLAKANVLADGTYTMTCKPTKNGWYHVIYAGGIDGTPSLAKTITVVPSVGSVGGNNTTIYRNKTYTFYGAVTPKVTLSMKVCRKNSSGVYVYYKTITGSYYDKTTSGYRYNAKWKPTAAGKYRLNFASGTPNGMNAASGSYRYLTVK